MILIIYCFVASFIIRVSIELFYYNRHASDLIHHGESIGNVFLALTPDAICLYRAGASMLAILIAHYSEDLTYAVPWLFSTALISDLVDGYLYRRYTVNYEALRSRPKVLGISPDQGADIALMLCGVYLGARYWLLLNPLGSVKLCLLVPLIGLVFAGIPKLFSRSAIVYTICQTLSAHVSCALMIFITVLAWRIYYADWTGIILTLIVFYGIFLKIGEKSRLIRRPPAEWWERAGASKQKRI